MTWQLSEKSEVETATLDNIISSLTTSSRTSPKAGYHFCASLQFKASKLDLLRQKIACFYQGIFHFSMY